jgi:hypothetical protein
MSLLVDVVGAIWFGGSCWHTVREYGARVDDRDVIEAAPVLGGLFVLAAYLAVSVGLHLAGVSIAELGLGLDAPEPMLVEWLWTRGVHLALLTMTALFLLEWTLWQADRITHEWRIVGGVERWT